MIDLSTYTLVCVDFETYYDDIFSLKNIESLEYIADPRFRVHMMGLNATGNAAETVVIRPEDIPAALTHLQSRGKPIALLCQNTQFDGLILSRHFGFTADLYLDTRAMSAGLWPQASASLSAIAVRLWPDNESMRKGNELALSKGVQELSPELFETLGRYCVNDVNLTMAVFASLIPQFPSEELRVIDILTRWCVDPKLELDYELIERYIPKLDAERRSIVANSGLWRFADSYNPNSKQQPQFVKEFAKDLAKGALTEADREYWLSLKVLNSNKAFAEWMRLNKLPIPLKTTPDNRQIPAFAQNDPEFMAMAKQYPQLNHVWAARGAAKSTQNLSRARRLVQTAIAYDGKVPVPLKYNAAHTGRAGGSDGLNLQNLQRNADAAHPDGDLRPGALRRSLIAPDGYVVLVCDLSNIEARMLAYLAEHTVLLDIFRAGGDPYSWMASKIYNRPISKKENPFERNVGKVALLSLGYGAGVERFTSMLHSGPMGLPPIQFDDKSMYARIVSTYRRDNAPVTSLWNWGGIMLEILMGYISHNWRDILTFEHHQVMLPNGLALHYPELRASEQGIVYTDKHGVATKLYGAKFVENVTQALATCIIKSAMTRIEDQLRPLGGQTVLQVHDEIVAICPEHLADEGLACMMAAMTENPPWCPDLPIAAEGGWARNYSK
jgi:DNA polymerase